MKAKSACCINLGCSENHLDGLLINRYLKSNNWELVDRPEYADLIIVNSCGYTADLERHSINTYHDLMSRKRPDAQIVFAGCVLAINKQAIQKAGYEGVLVTPRTLHLLDAVTNANISIDDAKSGCIPFSSDNIGLSFGYSYRFPYSFIQNIIRKMVAVLGAIPYFPIPRWL